MSRTVCLNKIIGLTVRNVTRKRIPIKNLPIDSLLISDVKSTGSYLNTDTRKFESSQKDENIAKSADSSTTYRKP